MNMAIVESENLAEYCLDVAKRAKRAAAETAQLSGAMKNDWLLASAARLREQASQLVEVNKLDLAAAPGYGLTDAQIDRLVLTEARIESIAVALEEIVALPDPVGEVISATVRPNGLQLSKVRVPLGVVFFIYESRPNVTADAAALCIKSGNAVILRGGKEAAHSSRAIVEILNQVGSEIGLPADAVQLVNTIDREAVGHFLALDEQIDVAIPRGGEGLIRRVATDARMPVIKHFAGNCHVYVDADADLTMAVEIAVNSKCQRMGVCNAAESLLVHADVAAEFLPLVGAAMAEKGIELRGDKRCVDLLPTAKLATDADWGTEYLGPIMSVAVVGTIDEAISHINQYGSGHTDVIVTGALAAARKFTSQVDSSAVIVNASTRFNDGGQFGLGAEIGISTDKFHARGPCGLTELTCYKYVVYGDGQIRD